MNRLAIIIPVKSPLLGKSRLASVLPPRYRHVLNLRLLQHTFAEVSALSDMADVLVVSSDPDVLTDAARSGFHVCPELGSCEDGTAPSRSVRGRH